MLNKLLSNALDRITLDKVRRFNASSLSFDRLSWAIVLLCSLVSNANDGAMERILVGALVETFL